METKVDRSLEILGVIIGAGGCLKQSDNIREFEDACQDVYERYDQDIDKLGVLLTYHAKEFVNHASAKNWNELIAMMGAVQHQQSKEEQGEGN